MGFEPTTSTVTGWRALHAALQDLIAESGDAKLSLPQTPLSEADTTPEITLATIGGNLIAEPEVTASLAVAADAAAVSHLYIPSLLFLFPATVN